MMADHVVDICVDDGLDVEAEPFAVLLGQMLGSLDLEPSELSVRFTNDSEIRKLNARWRGRLAATDVLSFPMADDDDDVGGLLGDIVVSLDTAARQAAEQGHSLEQEVTILLAHGLAHVLGYDHEEPDEAEEMRALEARLLAAANAQSVGLIDRAHAAATSLSS